jgi:3-oxoacyl-[acyl-carrier protein] reductase
MRLLNGRGLLEGVSSIVFIGSIYSLRGGSAVLAYCSAKAAIETATRSFARELAPHTRVNCVLPGHIDTNMMDGADAEFRQRVIDRTPLGRIGDPDEVAEIVEFLLFQGQFITGTSVVIDGGYQLS